MSTTLERSEGVERREAGADMGHVGVVGLAVMGENLARNIERNGFAPVVYNRTATRTEEFLAGPAQGTAIVGKFSVRDFVAALERPRRIILMVKAGNPVDAVVDELTPFLEAGDILIDGGNSFFHDTERRFQELADAGFHYVGMGVSGGEEGALWGPSLMPGGPDEAYAALAPMLTAIAAKSDSGPCVTHIGPGGSGHYVKMVHNGIEYGDMQLIAETYDVMRKALGMEAAEIAEAFARWNDGPLASFLIEITEKVLRFVDVETGAPLVDVIADEAEQKGTGRWTSQNSFELATPTPVINAAVIARGLSALKPLRVKASTILDGPGANGGSPPDRDETIDALEDGLYFAKVASYAQGMALMAAASDAYKWDLDLAEIARIWKAGCIIRAALLDPIMEAFAADRELDNLLFAPYFAAAMNRTMPGMRAARRIALDFGIPAPGMDAAINYVDTLRTEHLPANLIQGQRDFFGAHTYKRLDKPGTFHTEWATSAPEATPEAPQTKSKPSTRQAWAEGQGEGDRAERAAAAPAGARADVMRPLEHEELTPDAEERGERSEKQAHRADY